MILGHVALSPPYVILVIGTGMHGQLPVMDEVMAEAQRRGVEIVICSTPEAIQHLQENPDETNAILKRSATRLFR